ncbi:MAG: hypothetical protein RL701_5861 [Pseudomonadota bacterium]
MIGLIGIDVDGTLVGASGQVAPIVWEAAERARKRGIRLALCSGRPAFGTALDYARRLDPDGWHTFQNGASVVDLGSGRSRSTPLVASALQRLIAQARSTHELLELYTDRAWAVEIAPQWAHEHAQLLGVPLQQRAFETLVEPVVRAQWLVSHETAPLILAQPQPELEISHATSPIMPDTSFVALTAKGVDKGSALRAIAQEYGVTLEDVMYIGDAGNDLVALAIVGHPVAMADASPAVKQAARRIIGRAQDGAVAEALEIALASWA